RPRAHAAEPRGPGAQEPQPAAAGPARAPHPPREDARVHGGLSRSEGRCLLMRLAFVVQRYGLDIAGGAEYHGRLIAEHLSRHAAVDVLTTCARDYVTWQNHYPPGESRERGVRVRRFPVDAPRDPERFARLTARLFGEAARVEPGRVDADAAAR